MDISVYTHALDLWSNADLTKLQKQLDKDVIEAKDREAQFLESRKLLATETKKFKKLLPDEKLTHVNRIIKQYQQEIDSLTKRSKFSESVLLEVYAKLSEAPDPTPLLQNSVDKLSKIDDSKALREQIDVLEDKLAKYADYDTLKLRLLDLEQNSAVTLVKRITAKEQELNSTWEEKQRNWNEREAELAKQLEALRSKNEVLEATISKKIKISTSDGKDMDDGITLSSPKHTNPTEYNLLTQELESAQTRIFQLEKRNEELNGALAKATSAAEQELRLQSKETKIKQLESENALLSASSERERRSNSKVQADLNEELKYLKAETASYKSEINAIRMKLDNYSDYNQLKEDLSALKRIEFGTDDDDDDLSGGESETNGQAKVEASLLSANKKLQGKLAQMRATSADREEETISLKKQIDNLTSKVSELEKLNKKLELDLDKIEEVDKRFNDTASMMSGVTRQMNNRGGKLSPTSSIIGIPEDTDFPSMAGNNTILPIITKQRDRLRHRNAELEKQMRQTGIDRNKLKADITKLKADNTKLYERIRYLARGGSAEASSSIGAANTIDAEAQYSQVYENSLNPLASFKQKEIEYYKKNKLSVWEKLFLSFAKIILANKTTRMLFLFYCIGIHGLVFMMSMYVINLSGYMTPEVGIVQSSTSSKMAQNANFEES